MSHSLTRIWIHSIFSTKDRQPLLKDNMREPIFNHIKETEPMIEIMGYLYLYMAILIMNNIILKIPTATLGRLLKPLNINIINIIGSPRLQSWVTNTHTTDNHFNGLQGTP